MNGAGHRWDMCDWADRLVDYGLWPKAFAGALILGRCRVATLPQAMVSMAVGQKEIGQPPVSKSTTQARRAYLGPHSAHLRQRR